MVIINRSLIFVPAKEKMLRKINSMNADKFIIDLEDSINSQEKESALALVDAWLAGCKTDNVIVRVNKNNYEHEISLLSKYDIGFMLPKFEMISDYCLDKSISDSHYIVALIETPLGLININDISSCRWVNALAFGAEDYTSLVGMKNSNDFLLYQKSLIVNAAKANQKEIFGTPSFQLYDDILFKKEVDFDVDLGFSGKMAIHPKQIDYINKAFNSADIEYLKKIVDAYDRNNEAVFVFDEKVYEKMHIEHIKRVIKEQS